MKAKKIIKKLKKLKEKDTYFGWEKGHNHGLRMAIETIKKHAK